MSKHSPELTKFLIHSRVQATMRALVDRTPAHPPSRVETPTDVRRATPTPDLDELDVLEQMEMARGMAMLMNDDEDVDDA